MFFNILQTIWELCTTFTCRISNHKLQIKTGIWYIDKKIRIIFLLFPLLIEFHMVVDYIFRKLINMRNYQLMLTLIQFGFLLIPQIITH